MMMETDLLAGLESTLDVAWNEIKLKADVVRKLNPLPPVRCIPGQINQVFINLLVNAAQAIEGRGTITLSSGTDGSEVWIKVADSGNDIKSIKNDAKRWNTPVKLKLSQITKHKNKTFLKEIMLVVKWTDPVTGRARSEKFVTMKANLSLVEQQGG